MLIKEIHVRTGADFRQYRNITLVQGDAYAYKIIYATGQDLSNASFQVTALRADGSGVIGKGEIEEGKAVYILDNNMYDLAGDVRLRLTLIDETSVLTETELVCNVVSNNAEDQIEGDDRYPILTQLIQETEQFVSDTEARMEAEVIARTNGDIELQNQIQTKADKQTKGGGFAGGGGSNLTSGTGASVGYNANTTDGFAGGSGAGSNSGGAAGSGAYTENGSSTGKGAKAIDGGASGSGTATSNGFAGGKNAKCVNTAQYPATDYRSWIDAIQLGEGTNATPKTLQIYDYQLMDAEGLVPKERLATTEGGFAAGKDATSNAAGCAVGNNAWADTGAAIGKSAFCAGNGGAVGVSASAIHGFAGGGNAKVVWSGGAVGSGAYAGNGFSGGLDAKVEDAEDGPINAIQLGAGTNSTENTLQVYNYQLLDADGHIPKQRLLDPTGGGFAAGAVANVNNGGAAVGNTTTADNGGAVGWVAKAKDGGAVGYLAVTTDGFAGGKYAMCCIEDPQHQPAWDYPDTWIDAIQLGTGTNSTPKTLQIYDYQLMDANGKIPPERIDDVSAAGLTVNEDFNQLFVGAGAGTSQEYYPDLIAIGNDASAIAYGITIGHNSSGGSGGLCLGNNSSVGGGIAIGNNISSEGAGSIAIGGDTYAAGAIQIGEGENDVAYTFQVGEYQLLDADGYIPTDRLPQIGDLADLKTTSKTSIVAAINELYDLLPRGGDHSGGTGS